MSKDQGNTAVDGATGAFGAHSVADRTGVRGVAVAWPWGRSAGGAGPRSVRATVLCRAVDGAEGAWRRPPGHGRGFVRYGRRSDLETLPRNATGKTPGKLVTGQTPLNV